MTRRVRTAVSMGVREFVRTPVLLALLGFLPAYMIGVFVWLVSDTPVAVTLGGTTEQVPMTDLAAALMTPVTVAILSGIVGLFLIQSSQAADDRLRLAGYRPTDLVVSRVGTLAVGTLVVTAVSVFVATLAFTPERPLAFAAAAGIVGLTYGILGVVVGLVLDRLGGVYVLLFAPMIDILMFQNPFATEPPVWTTYLPGHFGTNVLFDAAFTAGVDLSDLLGASGYVVALLVVAIVIFFRSTDVR